MRSHAPAISCLEQWRCDGQNHEAGPDDGADPASAGGRDGHSDPKHT